MITKEIKQKIIKELNMKEWMFDMLMKKGELLEFLIDKQDTNVEVLNKSKNQLKDGYIDNRIWTEEILHPATPTQLKNLGDGIKNIEEDIKVIDELIKEINN